MSGVAAGYKLTEVGVIPEGWVVKPLSAVADIRGGIAKNANTTISDPISVHYLRVANVQDGFLSLGEMSKIELSRGDLPRYKVQPGDVLMNEGGDLDKLGRGAIWRGEFDPCVHQNHVFVVRCKAELLPEYLNIWTSTSPVRRFFLVAGKQTTNLASISKSSLGELPVVLPSLPEQRAIAAALSNVDALLAGLDRLIAKKRDLKQAAMQQLLTGQTRLPGFQGEWASTTFGQIAQPRRDRVDPRSAGIQHFCVELEHIAPASGELLGNTSAGEHSSLKSVFGADDVLFGKLRAYLRKYWLATRPGVCSTEIWVLAPRSQLMTTEFLFQLVKTDDFIEAASNSYGTHMPRSDWSIVENFELALPPMSEQTAIATILSDMDTELTALESRHTKTRALKQAMMQELLTGRTRLL